MTIHRRFPLPLTLLLPLSATSPDSLLGLVPSRLPPSTSRCLCRRFLGSRVSPCLLRSDRTRCGIESEREKVMEEEEHFSLREEARLTSVDVTALSLSFRFSLFPTSLSRSRRLFPSPAQGLILPFPALFFSILGLGAPHPPSSPSSCLHLPVCLFLSSLAQHWVKTSRPFTPRFLPSSF